MLKHAWAEAQRGEAGRGRGRDVEAEGGLVRAGGTPSAAGSVVAALLHSDAERREFISAGAAAGLAVSICPCLILLYETTKLMWGWKLPNKRILSIPRSAGSAQLNTSSKGIPFSRISSQAQVCPGISCCAGTRPSMVVTSAAAAALRVSGAVTCDMRHDRILLARACSWEQGVFFCLTRRRLGLPSEGCSSALKRPRRTGRAK